MPNGILNVDKPLGQTSHDVVERVRALTGIRRVGHAGTLDPMATGVLVVCIGRSATRVSKYLMDSVKIYRADVRLGVTTNTFDAEGEIVTELPVNVDRREIEAALQPLRGTIEQVPPMYSAVKHEGKPLYHFARRGVEVEREARQVEIHQLELTAWDPPWCTLKIVCSPGTYIRTLVHDLGQELGCGAYVTGLRRLASGIFRLEDAVALDEFAQAVQKGRWSELLCPVDQALASRFPALRLSADAARRLCSGQAIPADERRVGEGSLARTYDAAGRFLALAVYDPGANVWRPHKVFVSPYSSPNSSQGR